MSYSQSFSKGSKGLLPHQFIRPGRHSLPLVADVLDGCIRSHSPIQAPEGGRLVRVK